MRDRFGKTTRADNWRPSFVKTGIIIAGNATMVLIALVFSVFTGSALGITGHGLLIAVTDALIDGAPVEKANRLWSI